MGCARFWETESETKYETNTKVCLERHFKGEHLWGVNEDTTDIVLGIDWFPASWDGGRISGFSPDVGAYSTLARIMCFQFKVPFVDPFCEAIHGTSYLATSRDSKFGIFNDWEEECMQIKRRNGEFYEKWASHHVSIFVKKQKENRDNDEEEEEEGDEKIVKGLKIAFECDDDNDDGAFKISSYKSNLQTLRGLRLHLNEETKRCKLWREGKAVGGSDLPHEISPFALCGAEFSMLNSNRWYPKDNRNSINAAHPKNSKVTAFLRQNYPCKPEAMLKSLQTFSLVPWRHFKTGPPPGGWIEKCTNEVADFISRSSKLSRETIYSHGLTMDMGDGYGMAAICAAMRGSLNNKDEHEHYARVFAESINRRLLKSEMIGQLASLIISSSFLEIVNVPAYPKSDIKLEKTDILKGTAIEIYLLGVFWNWLVKTPLDTLLLDYKVEKAAERTSRLNKKWPLGRVPKGTIVRSILLLAIISLSSR